MNEAVRRALEAAGVVFEQRLGAGSFAEVWRVSFRNLARAMRICLSPMDDSRDGQLAAQERDTLRQIVAIPELCNISGFIEELPLSLPGDPPEEYFVTVWQLATANLAEWWRKAPLESRDEQLLPYLAQVARMIDLLGEFGFHHRDVKAENILLGGDAARLCDLGLAKQVGLTTYKGTYVITPGHAPPEMLADGESHATHDLYSLAASYLRLKTRLDPPAFLDMLERRQLPPGLQTAEAPLVAAALDPAKERRPQTGAAAWVRSLQATLVGDWAMEQDAIATRTGPRERRSAEAAVLERPEVLLGRLEKLSPHNLLDRIALTLGAPSADRPSPQLTHGERCQKVVEWAQSHECLAGLHDAIEALRLRK